MDENKNVVPFELIPQIHTGSFLTKEQAEQFKEAFKDMTVVVRCKDCKECYFASNRVPHEQSWACGKHGIDVTLDWYCADGDRR